MSNEAISAVADVITAIVSAVLVLGVFIAYRQLRSDHDRSRREFAVTLISQWARGLDTYASSSRKLVEALDDDTCRKLFSQDEFDVPEDKVPLLIACLDDASLDHSGLSPKTEGNPVTISPSYRVSRRLSSEIRWRVVTYLNNLETVLSSWRHNVADRTIIEEQFRFLFAPEKGHRVLESFRKAAGGKEGFPAVTEFAMHLDKCSATIAPGMERTGV